ncbi:F0F1 ATP synthase subunit delta [bacterium]|nr:F0F1 ATP synthase subunit delta [bacterium]
MKSLKERVQDYIYTKEDLNLFIQDAEKISDLVFKNPKLSLREKIEKSKEKISNKFYDFFLELSQDGYSNKEKILKELEETKEELLKLPVLKIQLAFSPSPSFIKEISDWLKRNLKKKVLLDVEVNPVIVGGAILEYRGRYLDLSLKKEIEKLNIKDFI